MGGNGRQFLNRIRNGRPERKDPLPIQGMTRIAVWRFTIFPETTQSTWAFAGTDPRLFPSSRLSFNCLLANTSVGSELPRARMMLVSQSSQPHAKITSEAAI